MKDEEGTEMNADRQRSEEEEEEEEGIWGGRLHRAQGMD